jgi:cyclophilin family peptidyl-prolyl cis-trans isomerase
MQRRLSQPFQHPIARLRRIHSSASNVSRLAFLVSTTVLGVIALTGLGCDGSLEGREAASTASGGQAAADREAYAWPSAKNHPMLRIEVDGAAGPGTIEIELMPELAPVTVAQVIEWADDGFYDDTTFHRVIKGFMVQGGDPNTRDKDPNNDGKGGPDLSLDDEFGDAPFIRGVVAMGNRGRKNSSGSQFFITQADSPHLDGGYTVIGRVRSGMEIVDAMVEVEIDTVGRWGPAARPIENVVMKRVRAFEPELAANNP